MKRLLLALLLLLVLLFVSSTYAQVVAFPGAEGAGAASVGGRGGVVFEVTSLSDSGAGTLRACVIASGPRTCVFRTGGTITLSSSLHILNPFITIAGQTAPGGGIQVTNSSTCNVSSNCDLIRIGTHDVIIRYVRMRRSTESGTNFSSPTSILNENANAYNVIWDHCSMAWGEWDNWDIFQGSFNSFVAHDLTLQWSLLAEPRFDTNNAVDIQISGANSTLSNLMNDIDVHHNFLSGADHRNPIHRTVSGRIVNNLVYNAHYYDIKAGGNKDIIGNYIKAGPYTTSPLVPIQTWTAVAIGTTSPPSLYIAGNAADANSFNPAANQWTGTLTGLAPGEDNSNTVTSPISTTFQRLSPMAAVGKAITVNSATDLAVSNGVLLSVIGASQKLSDTSCDGSFVANIDTADSTFISQFLANTGHSSNITAPGTLPTLAAGTPCTSTQHDGIADAWKTKYGLSTSNATLYQTVAPNGYTYLESYLGGLPPTSALFFAQTAAGAANGTSCTNAYAYNDGTHGINVAGNWVPGNRLVLCPSFTLSSNTNLVTAQASGTSGNPITVDLTGATLNSPFWPGDPVNGCSSNCGAIDTNNKQYITIIGGGTGVIQNTANGSSLANQAHTIGVYLRGDNLMLKGTTIRNLYLVTSSETNTPNPPGFFSADVFVNGGTNVEICNNNLNNAHEGIASSSVSASLTAPPSTNCTASQASAGVNFYNNTFVDHGWHLNIGGNGFINAFNNDLTISGSWGFPTGTNSYHLDGFIVFGGSANSVPKPQIFNNYIHGDYGIGNPTGFIFCTYDGSNDGSGSACTIYNNLIVGTGATATGAQGVYFHRCETVAPFGCGPHLFYNNTVVGFNTGDVFAEVDPNITYTVKDNIFVSGGGWYWQPNTGAALPNLTIDYNTYFGGRNFGGGIGGFPGNRDLPTWQTFSGQDLHSHEVNPNLATNYFLQAGSPSIGAGLNLTSLGILPLNIGKPQNVGVNGSCGSGCLSRPSGLTPWDNGAYPFASGVSVPAVPTGLTATVNGSTVILLWNPSTGTPAGYFVNRNGVQIANVTSGTTFADTGLANGTYSYTVAAYNSAGTSAFSTPASATVSTACSINLNPPSLSFGTVTQGTASQTQNVTVTNLGTASCTSVVVANPSGPNGADFSQTNGCGGTLAVNATCTVTYTFTPSINGTVEQASGAITSSDPNSPDTVTLTGTGGVAVVLSPPTITLANTYTSHTSATAVLTYTNQSGSSITVSSIVFSTGDAAMFAETDNCVGTVTNGSSCTINITFTPTSNGNKTTNLIITDSAPGSPRTVVVSGRASGHGIIRIGVAI